MKETIYFSDGSYKYVFPEPKVPEVAGGITLVDSINPHIPGAKLDSEKPMMDLVFGDFSKALVEVTKVGTMGAKKYSEHGWLEVPDAKTRYLSAMQRHYYNHKDSDINDVDDESHLLHLAHMAWNALASLELHLRTLG
jgi:hypothetical protein